MPKEIWSEGRVVGYSAYEIYVKQHLSEDAVTPPASEREWLAASLAMGSSLLYKLPDVTQSDQYGYHYLTFELPSNSNLAAANTIVASYFDGEGYLEDPNSSSGWAVHVASYGSLLPNNSATSPSGVAPSEVIPAADIPTVNRARLSDYMKIVDGVVINRGSWVTSDVQPPQKDFQPSFGSYRPYIRLRIKGKITNHPWILFTGFTIKAVLAGTVGSDTSIDTTAPEDGDFLGPAAFPWASKIIFSVPNSYITQVLNSHYERSIESPTSQGSLVDRLVEDSLVIDMQASKPETFYNSYASYYSRFTNSATNPRYQYTVVDFATGGDPPDDGASVLTVYQKKDIYPPALYGTFVGSTGTQYLNPLDVVAPGTVKMFYDQSVATLQDYQTTFPGTTSMNRTSDGTIQVLNDQGNTIAISDVRDVTVQITSPRGVSVNVKAIGVDAGKKSGLALALSPAVTTGDATTGQIISPTPYTIDTKPTNVITLDATNSNDNIAWSALLDALINNRAIDLLGTRLKSAKVTLIDSSPYLEFGPENGKKRLYIASTAPATANVPEGSIGIGWGLQY